jgi:hypothetical protein
MSYIESKEDHDLLRAASKAWMEMEYRATLTQVDLFEKIGPALVAAKRFAKSKSNGGDYHTVMSAVLSNPKYGLVDLSGKKRATWRSELILCMENITEVKQWIAISDERELTSPRTIWAGYKAWKEQEAADAEAERKRKEEEANKLLNLCKQPTGDTAGASNGGGDNADYDRYKPFPDLPRATNIAEAKAAGWPAPGLDSNPDTDDCDPDIYTDWAYDEVAAAGIELKDDEFCYYDKDWQLVIQDHNSPTTWTLEEYQARDDDEDDDTPKRKKRGRPKKQPTTTKPEPEATTINADDEPPAKLRAAANELSKLGIRLWKDDGGEVSELYAAYGEPDDTDSEGRSVSGQLCVKSHTQTDACWSIADYLEQFPECKPVVVPADPSHEEMAQLNNFAEEYFGYNPDWWQLARAFQEVVRERNTLQEENQKLKDLLEAKANFAAAVKAEAEAA